MVSRDQAERRYVQDVLAEQMQRCARGSMHGAAIYVCGSLEGMAAGVDAALGRLGLGAAATAATSLQAAGR
jgi:sulfite reductase (NADPH) flavoprotein alpha-component